MTTAAETDAWGFPTGPWHGTGEAVKFQQTTADKDAERDLKWARMLHPTKGFSGVPTAVLKRRWRKGVPRGWRRAAWPELMDHGPAEFKTAAGLRQITYQSLVNSPPSSYDEPGFSRY